MLDLFPTENLRWAFVSLFFQIFRQISGRNSEIGVIFTNDSANWRILGIKDVILIITNLFHDHAMELLYTHAW